jgi:ABC-type Fe3+-hydroxamate transport system substrate-binding protein
MVDKREKFLQLAENRVNKALKQISLIGNLSNKNVYEYNDEEVKKIFRALRDEIKLAESRFTNVGKKKFKI